MKKVLFAIILFFINAEFSIGQKHIQADTSIVTVRSFDNVALRELKNDKDFQYDRLSQPPESLWEKFWNWVWWKIEEIMRTKSGRITVWTILIAFGIAAIIFFVTKVMGMSGGGLFARAGKSSLLIVFHLKMQLKKQLKTEIFAWQPGFYIFNH